MEVRCDERIDGVCPLIVLVVSLFAAERSVLALSVRSLKSSESIVVLNGATVREIRCSSFCCGPDRMKSMRSDVGKVVALAARGSMECLDEGAIEGTGGTAGAPSVCPVLLLVRPPVGDDERDAEAPWM